MAVFEQQQFVLREVGHVDALAFAERMTGRQREQEVFLEQVGVGELGVVDRHCQDGGVQLAVAQTVQQMFYASISLAFHTADPAKLDTLAEVKRLQAKYTPFAYVDGTSFHTSFGHLMGYSAVYYTYMWSLVIAKDLFSSFEGDLMNRAAADRYRQAVLAAEGG